MAHESNKQSSELENAFFVRENAKLLAELRRRAEHESLREQLREVVQIKDAAFLDRLIALGITPATALALRLIPLVFVAWADGTLDAKEREAVYAAARKSSVAAGEAAHGLLDDWLGRMPDPHLLDLWKQYVGHLWGSFTADERWQMRTNLLQSAHEVAKASGGLFGLTSKVSAEERKVLEQFEQMLD
jgi:tellurite resistance protein